ELSIGGGVEHAAQVRDITTAMAGLARAIAREKIQSRYRGKYMPHASTRSQSGPVHFCKNHNPPYQRSRTKLRPVLVLRFVIPTKVRRSPGKFGGSQRSRWNRREFVPVPS